MRVVVIGGDAAGASAASTVKRAHPEWDVIMFEKGDWTSYAACGFPYVLGGLIEPWEKLIARSPQEHRRRGLDVRLRTEVTAIDLGRRVVHYHDHDSGADGEEPFDRLLYATGATATKPPIPGIELGHFLQTPRQARLLGTKLKQARRALVVGGGYIGLEMAESLRRREMRTVLIDAAPQVMGTLDADMAALVQEAMEEIGTEVHLGTPLRSIERRGDGYTVDTPQGVIETDVVILALGSRPRVELAKDGGLPLGETGAVAVDHRSHTTVEGVYAAGDCAEVWHLVKKRWVNIHLGTVANKTGRIAGINLAGGSASFPGAIGTAVSKICRYEVARTGLTESEAAEMDLPVVTARIESRTRAHYYPDAGPIEVKLVARASDRVLVGGQIVGTEGAAKRIDVVAAAITAGLAAQQVVDLDLSYAPPYSPVWDPVQMAARQMV